MYQQKKASAMEAFSRLKGFRLLWGARFFGRFGFSLTLGSRAFWGFFRFFCGRRFFYLVYALDNGA
jgi:hypothetical protein